MKGRGFLQSSSTATVRTLLGLGQRQARSCASGIRRFAFRSGFSDFDLVRAIVVHFEICLDPRQKSWSTRGTSGAPIAAASAGPAGRRRPRRRTLEQFSEPRSSIGPPCASHIAAAPSSRRSRLGAAAPRPGANCDAAAGRPPPRGSTCHSGGAPGRQPELSAASDSHRRTRSPGTVDDEPPTASWSRGCARSCRPECRKLAKCSSRRPERRRSVRLPAGPIRATAGRDAER